MRKETGQNPRLQIWVALILLAAGAFVAWHATQYDIGTLRRMGPGYFPMLLGVSQCVLAAVILLTPDRQSTPSLDTHLADGNVSDDFHNKARWRSHLRAFVFVLGAIVLFAALIRHAGFAPATAVATLVAGLAEPDNSVLDIVLLSIGVTIGASLIFVFALGVPIPLVAF